MGLVIKGSGDHDQVRAKQPAGGVGQAHSECSLEVEQGKGVPSAAAASHSRLAGCEGSPALLCCGCGNKLPQCSSAGAAAAAPLPSIAPLPPRYPPFPAGPQAGQALHQPPHDRLQRGGRHERPAGGCPTTAFIPAAPTCLLPAWGACLEGRERPCMLRGVSHGCAVQQERWRLACLCPRFLPPSLQDFELTEAQLAGEQVPLKWV